MFKDEQAAGTATGVAHSASSEAASRDRLQMGGFSALAVDTRVDHFIVDTVLGAGGFGITYLAQHDALSPSP